MTTDSIMLDNYKENVPIIVVKDTSGFYFFEGRLLAPSFNHIDFNKHLNKYVNLGNRSKDTIIKGFEISYDKVTNQLLLINKDTLPYQYSTEKTIGFNHLKNWREELVMNFWREKIVGEEDNHLIFSTRQIKISNSESTRLEPYDSFIKIKKKALNYEELKNNHSIYFYYEHNLLFLRLSPFRNYFSYTTYLVERIEEDRIILRCIEDKRTGKNYWEKVEWHKVKNPSDTLEQINTAYIKIILRGIFSFFTKKHKNHFILV